MKISKYSIYNVPSREVILAIWDLGNEWKELTNGCISTKYGTQLNYIQKHWEESEYYLKEKQGKQKSFDYFDYENANIKQKDFAPKQEQKFHEGDWVVNRFGDVWHIDSFDKKNYQVSDEKGNYNYFPISKQDEMHHWTIQDAKDGDVLCSEQIIILFKKWEYNSDWNYVIAYAGIDITGKLQITNEHWLISNHAHPATKEQRDLLFTKMKEVGYEWDYR